MIEKSQLKTEYVRMTNEHHREMELLRKRNELAEQYSKGIERKALRFETAWLLLTVALALLCASLLFGGGI